MRGTGFDDHRLAVGLPVTAPDLRSRLEALGRRDPTLAPVLPLYEAALVEAADPSWDAAVLPPALPGPPARPRLSAATLALDPARTGDWLVRLTRAAGGLADGALAACAARLDPTALVLAAARLDDAAIADMARRATVLPETVAALAHLAALPLLAAAGRRLGPAPVDWDEGSCPICGAWPTLAERRGIENVRVLRCGRCTTGWAFPWLRCPFCGTRDHEQLGALVPEADTDRRKVDVCRACQGFIKSVPTLTPLASHAVVLEDLANVDLDVVALERGFVRPGRPPAAPLAVCLAREART